jgi:uncharacterized membrane protein required for colicin V production
VWSWRDRIIGIVLGVILGIAVILAFVFLFSEQTVDAPSLSGKQAPAATTSPSRR